MSPREIKIQQSELHAAKLKGKGAIVANRICCIATSRLSPKKGSHLKLSLR
jgi:hypothetical protein